MSEVGSGIHSEVPVATERSGEQVSILYSLQQPENRDEHGRALIPHQWLNPDGGMGKAGEGKNFRAIFYTTIQSHFVCDLAPAELGQDHQKSDGVSIDITGDDEFDRMSHHRINIRMLTHTELPHQQPLLNALSLNLASEPGLNVSWFTNVDKNRGLGVSFKNMEASRTGGWTTEVVFSSTSNGYSDLYVEGGFENLAGGTEYARKFMGLTNSVLKALPARQVAEDKVPNETLENYKTEQGKRLATVEESVAWGKEVLNPQNIDKTLLEINQAIEDINMAKDSMRLDPDLERRIEPLDRSLKDSEAKLDRVDKALVQAKQALGTHGDGIEKFFIKKRINFLEKRYDRAHTSEEKSRSKMLTKRGELLQGEQLTRNNRRLTEANGRQILDGVSVEKFLSRYEQEQGGEGLSKEDIGTMVTAKEQLLQELKEEQSYLDKISQT